MVVLEGATTFFSLTVVCSQYLCEIGNSEGAACYNSGSHVIFCTGTEDFNLWNDPQAVKGCGSTPIAPLMPEESKSKEETEEGCAGRKIRLNFLGTAFRFCRMTSFQ